MVRGLLAHFAAWKGIRTTPPDWLIRSIRLRGAIRYKPQVRVLLLRQLQQKPPPPLSEIIQGNDRSWHVGWNYLIYQFLESGGLEKNNSNKDSSSTGATATIGLSWRCFLMTDIQD